MYPDICRLERKGDLITLHKSIYVISIETMLQTHKANIIAAVSIRYATVRTQHHNVIVVSATQRFSSS